MRSESYSVGEFRVVRIWEDLGIDSDLSELKKTVEHDHSLVHLVLAFTEDSCLYSRTAAVLMECYKILHRRNGSMGIIKPNHSISFVLDTIGLRHLMKTYESEEAIAHQEVAV
jgi:hypothetical protein